MPVVVKRKEKKKPVNRLPHIPERGDCFLFRYHNHHTCCHKVYEDFPDGGQVKPDHCFVDFSKPIYVEQVRQATMNGSDYVAVGFVLPEFFGVELWTNYSKDGSKWLMKASL